MLEKDSAHAAEVTGGWVERGGGVFSCLGATYTLRPTGAVVTPKKLFLYRRLCLSRREAPRKPVEAHL